MIKRGQVNIKVEAYELLAMLCDACNLIFRGTGKVTSASEDDSKTTIHHPTAATFLASAKAGYRESRQTKYLMSAETSICQATQQGQRGCRC